MIGESNKTKKRLIKDKLENLICKVTFILLNNFNLGLKNKKEDDSKSVRDMALKKKE